MITCPRCGAEERDIIGHEVRGVYDGVLYWSCAICKHAWERGGFTGYRKEKAKESVALHNETVAVARREALDG